MYIINGIAYARKNVDELKVEKVKLLENFTMIIYFNNNVEKIFDVKDLKKIPVFNQLSDVNVFNTAKIDRGILTWLDGQIDISTEELYDICYTYDKLPI